MACLFNFDQISQCWLKTRSIDNAGTTAKFSKLFLQLISSRISTGRDVLLSLCPGTRAAARILGKTSLSQDVPGQKMFKKALNFQKKTFCPVVVPGLSGTGWDRLSKSRPGPFRGKVSKPVPGFDWLSWPVPACGKILSLSRCPFVPGQWRNFCPFVLKSCTVPSRWKP